MLLAEIAAEGWVLIIGAIFLGLTNLLVKLRSMHLEYEREQAKIARDAEAAVKVAEVKKTLETATKATDEKLAAVASDAKVVRAATQAMAHVTVEESVKAGVRNDKLDTLLDLGGRIDKQTNGALDAIRGEIESVRRELAAERCAHEATRTELKAALLAAPPA